MSAFLYYVPGKTGRIGLGEVREAGLGYALEKFVAAEVVRGPCGGGAGVVLAEASSIAAGRIRYLEDSQTWRRILKARESGVCVGIYTDEKPGPMDLVRDITLGGHPVEMGDGIEWIAPVALAMSEIDDKTWGRYIKLPQQVTVDEEDRWITDGVIPKYKALFEIAERWADTVDGAVETAAGNRAEVEFEEGTEAAVAALAANYRIGATEAVLLDLLNIETIREVLFALIDRPTLMRWLDKKKDAGSGGAGSSDGAGD